MQTSLDKLAGTAKKEEESAQYGGGTSESAENRGMSDKQDFISAIAVYTCKGGVVLWGQCISDSESQGTECGSGTQTGRLRTLDLEKLGHVVLSLAQLSRASDQIRLTLDDEINVTCIKVAGIYIAIVEQTIDAPEEVTEHKHIVDRLAMDSTDRYRTIGLLCSQCVYNASNINSVINNLETEVGTYCEHYTVSDVLNADRKTSLQGLQTLELPVGKGTVPKAARVASFYSVETIENTTKGICCAFLGSFTNSLLSTIGDQCMCLALRLCSGQEENSACYTLNYFARKSLKETKKWRGLQQKVIKILYNIVLKNVKTIHEVCPTEISCRSVDNESAVLDHSSTNLCSYVYYDSGKGISFARLYDKEGRNRDMLISVLEALFQSRWTSSLAMKTPAATPQTPRFINSLHMASNHTLSGSSPPEILTTRRLEIDIDDEGKDFNVKEQHSPVHTVPSAARVPSQRPNRFHTPARKLKFIDDDKTNETVQNTSSAQLRMKPTAPTKTLETGNCGDASFVSGIIAHTADNTTEVTNSQTSDHGSNFLNNTASRTTQVPGQRSQTTARQPKLHNDEASGSALPTSSTHLKRTSSANSLENRSSSHSISVLSSKGEPIMSETTATHHTTAVGNAQVGVQPANSTSTMLRRKHFKVPSSNGG